MPSLILYSIAVFLFSLLGGVLPLLVSDHFEHWLSLFISFGAGVLLGMAFLHILPEASLILPHQYGKWVLGGFLCLLILERFVMVHSCEEQHCNYHTLGISAFIGLMIHGVIEGWAMASSFFVSHLKGLVLFAIVAHKVPETFALGSILRLANKPKKTVLLFLCGVALATPVSLCLSYLFLSQFPISNFYGILLSVTAGTFIYIGACDLLPELHVASDQKWWRLGGFALGLCMAAMSGLLS